MSRIARLAPRASSLCHSPQPAVPLVACALTPPILHLRRQLSTTRAHQLAPSPPARSLLSKIAQPYGLYRATNTLYDACARPAAYAIPPEQRRAGTVPKTAAGEEIGIGAARMFEDVHGPGGVAGNKNKLAAAPATSVRHNWHAALGLLPTFSTWSQVTMLHAWVLTAVVRDAADAELAQNTTRQLTDHMFHGIERVMGDMHGISSATLRQRYLQDLFVQWRGLSMSYDEGLVRGDVVLAAAVWRNLFGGGGGVSVDKAEVKEDSGVDGRSGVDGVRLAAVVAWIRGTVADLASRDVGGLLVQMPGEQLFNRSIADEVDMVRDMSRKMKPVGAGDGVRR